MLQKKLQLDSMDVELLYLPELGSFGDYLVFSWNVLADTLFRVDCTCCMCMGDE